MPEMEILKSNREKEKDLVATSRAERGIVRHVLVGQASCLSCLGRMGILPVPFNRRAGSPSYRDQGLEACLTFCVTLRSYPLRVQNFLELP
jgi:hypothetical protein